MASDRRVETAIAQRVEAGATPEAARAQAEKIFREIAANMNSTFLAAIGLAASAVIRRLFQSIEVRGIERVAEWAKRQPVVLVPSHRSYFDFVIISTLFYSNYLVPPHILARENMAFGPFGFLWRRCGAFFVRRSMDDPVYKEVFRAYVDQLIARGYMYKEIAARLHLSVKTVESHVSSVLRKLQLSTRHELARWATQHRLV